jgi:hypothetical protein
MKPKIPRGYRKLRKGTILREGDLFELLDESGWVETVAVGKRIGIKSYTDMPYIRRAARRGRK